MGNTRYHGMDFLRAIAMLLGVFLHSIIVYMEEPPSIVFPHDTNSSSLIFDYLYDFIHIFRMPLFFIVAGFFARLVIEKKGLIFFIKNRFRRIVIPWFGSLFFIVPLTAFSFYLYRNYINRNNELYDAVKLSIIDMTSWNGMYHLWFLYQLVIFYIILILLKKIPRPRFNLNKILFSPFSTLGLISIIILASISIILFHDHDTSPWVVYTGILPNPGQTVYYGLYFFLGYYLHHLGMKIPRKDFAIALLLIGSLLFIIKYQFTINGIVKQLIWAAEAITLTLSLLALFNILFKRESATIRYISDASYWMYLIHFPIITLLHTFFIKIYWPSTIELLITLSITLIISFWTYSKFVRYTIIGTVLNGKRLKKTPNIKLALQ